MTDHPLRAALCHSITARAHLAGAEAAKLEAQAKQFGREAHKQETIERAVLHDLAAACLTELAADARRRYWREVSAVQLLMGRRWPEAEALGVEPPASQED